MATSSELGGKRQLRVIIRLAAPELQELLGLVFRRYPQWEWATFARFGWREAEDQLILTLAGIDAPGRGDLDEHVGHVAIQEPYTLRTALAAEGHPLGVGVIHSHPEDCPPHPSRIDDDMDSYYADYLQGFAPGRPYVSLIIAKVDGTFAVSGRICFRNQWHLVTHVIADRWACMTWVGGQRPAAAAPSRERTKRLIAAFGDEAAARLRRATVAVVGAGGTGSAAIETLARAGVGRLIVVDPDQLEESNLERVHGSRPEHAAKRVSKAALALDHVKSIDPKCVVEAYQGALPQEAIIDALVTADVAIGCTDNQHSRLALSDLAMRYLVPSIDCAVMLEGGGGKVTGQIAQFVRFLASDPCALCRSMINPQRITQELMSEGERQQRRVAAVQAHERGENAGVYWHEQPQLNTVGYLTTATGALAAGYAIGWITGRFDPPFSRLQLNLVAPYFDVTDFDQTPRPHCACRRVRGWADQGNADALITAPAHWPAVQRL